MEGTGRGNGGRTDSSGGLSRLLRRKRPQPDQHGGAEATEQAGFSLGIPGYEEPVLLGQGGFGSVYRARQVAFDRTVAIKILSAPGLDADLRLRFEQECQALGKVSGHPNIVSVFDSGFTDMGRAYLAMSYNPGGSLADRVQSQGPMAWEEAVDIGVKLAGALETAHRAGILHRDIKPENVLISDYGEPQLADFGSAAIHEGTVPPSTVVTATLPHAAPEVLDDRPASRATDVYSLASTVFTLVAGRPAFAPKAEEDVRAVVARIVTDPVPDLRAQGVPDGLCRVLERAMAKQPTARHAQALDFGADLQGVQEDAGLPVTPMHLVEEPAESEVAPAVEAQPRPEPVSEVAPAVEAQPPSGWPQPPSAVVPEPPPAVEPEPPPAAEAELPPAAESEPPSLPAGLELPPAAESEPPPAVEPEPPLTAEPEPEPAVEPKPPPAPAPAADYQPEPPEPAPAAEPPPPPPTPPPAWEEPVDAGVTGDTLLRAGAVGRGAQPDGAPERARRRRWPWVTAAAVAGVLLGGLAALLLRTVLTAESDDADLSITASEIATGQVGQDLTYEITVANRGPGDASEVTVVDPVPSGAGFRAARSHPSCTLTGTAVTCRPGKVGKRSSVKVPITFVALQPGGITHTVTVSGAEADPRTANNAATVKTSVRR